MEKEIAEKKIKRFCSYQERHHEEVRSKLYSFKLRKSDVEDVLANLVEENYLNEERFARLFAGGKFRMKKWGRNKIVFELKQKRISDYCIKKALTEIDEQEYDKAINYLIEKRLPTTKGDQVWIKKKKISNYIVGKGYEYSLVNLVINNFFESI